jgi:hypothetical protein
MSVEGNWQLVIGSPMGKQQVTVVFQENDGVLTGTLTNNANQITTEIFDGSVDGDELRWKVKMKQMNMTLAFNTTVDENNITGKVKAGMFGKFAVSGKREG